MASPPYHLGFVDGAIRWTQNLTSLAWSIYRLSHTLVHFAHVCIDLDTNNHAEYNAIIDLLVDATHHLIPHLCVHLDSQLLVGQLNHTYIIHDLILFCRYLRLQLLFRQCSYRSSNAHVDTLDNEVLD
jgi:ribonuclease HI